MIALTEFGVSKAVGFEKEDDRMEKALRRRDNWLKRRQDIEPKRWHLVGGDFEYLLRRGELKGESLRDATLIFYGLFIPPMSCGPSGGHGKAPRADESCIITTAYFPK